MTAASALATLRDAPWICAVAAMRAWARLPVREDGRNRGRWVDAIIEYGGGEDESGDAWCVWCVAAAWHVACHALQMRCHIDEIRHYGGAVRMWLRASGDQRIHVEDVIADPHLLRPGDIYVRVRDPRHVDRARDGHTAPGHVGMIVGARQDGWLHTVEGNTSSKDSAEGDGVYDKPKGIHIEDSRLLGYVRPACSRM